MHSHDQNWDDAKGDKDDPEKRAEIRSLRALASKTEGVGERYGFI